MFLRVIREPSRSDHTLGALYIDGKWFCWTLEDVLREPADVRPVAEWKIAGKTAIPAGTYRYRISLSNRFKMDLPELLGVPGFTGVRIHVGNTEKDTEGCLLVGNARTDQAVLNSADTMARLIPILTVRGGGTGWIRIENPLGFVPPRVPTTLDA